MELAREQLLNTVLQDEELIEQFLETGDVPWRAALAEARRAVIEGRVVPVFCGAAKHNQGVHALLDALVALMPSPTDRLDPRLPHDGPFAGLAFKIQRLPHLGALTYVRVYAGELVTGMPVLNSRTGRTERAERLLVVCADDGEVVERLGPGEIGAVLGLSGVGTGDTLCDPDHPLDFGVMAFPEPVLSVALWTDDEESDQRLEAILQERVHEDPTLALFNNDETGERLLSGMGELHLEVVLERLRGELAEMSIRSSQPRVAFRETIERAATGIGEIDTRRGGRGRYARVELRVEPLEAGEGVQVEAAEIQSVPRELLDAALTGITESLRAGPVLGYPLADLRVTVTNSHHKEFDSTESEFRAAGRLSLKRALSEATPHLLEPIMILEIMTPDEYTGAVIGDLSARRGDVTGMIVKGRLQVLSARAPLARLFGYATDLRSMTRGLAGCSIHFSHYEPLPTNLATELIERGRQR